MVECRFLEQGRVGSVGILTSTDVLGGGVKYVLSETEAFKSDFGRALKARARKM